MVTYFELKYYYTIEFTKGKKKKNEKKGEELLKHVH